MAATLVVTNDFPPRIGGIETFVFDVCQDLGRDVIVLTSRTPGRRAQEDEFDAKVRFPVVRYGTCLLPTPSATRLAVDLLRTHQSRQVLFGAAAPLGLMAPALRRAGARRIVGLTHGHEVWWAATPAKVALRRIGASVDFLGAISSFTSARIEQALAPHDRSKLLRIPPGVDVQRFTPSTVTEPVVLSVARMVGQKNHRRLLEAWRELDVPGARLILVGEGPERRSLERFARTLDGVEFLGERTWSELPALYAQASVFALPVDSLLGGLYSEGYGRVFAEAAAAGLPVIAGASGGVSDVVHHGATGLLVDPRHTDSLTRALHLLLTDHELRRRMGRRARVRAELLLDGRARGQAVRAALGLPQASVSS